MKSSSLKLVETLGEAFDIREWRTVIDEVRATNKQPIPEGWISATDLGEQIKCSAGNAGRYLKKLFDAKKIDRQKLNGMFYYKLKKK